MSKFSVLVQFGLDAAFFAWATAVVGNGCAVLDDADFQANRLESANGRFAARSGTFHAHFDFAHAMGHGLARRVLSDLLRSECGAFAGALESDAPGSGPTGQIALHVSDGHLRVVEGGKNVRNPNRDILCTLG